MQEAIFSCNNNWSVRKQAEKPTQRAKFKKTRKEERKERVRKVGEESMRERNGGSQTLVGLTALGKQFSEGLK